MEKMIKSNKITKLLLLTGAVYFFLKYISPLIGPILVAMLFVTIFGPFLQNVQKKLHIHRQVGAVLLLLTAGILMIGLIWVLFSWIMGSLPEWLGSLEAVGDQVRQLLHGGCELVGQLIGVDSSYLEKTIWDYLEEGVNLTDGTIMPDMLSRSFEYMRTAAMLGVFLATFIIATVLLAKDYDDIMNRLLDNEEYHVFLEVICGVIRYIATYVKAQFIIMLAIGLLASTVLGFAGVQHGVLWGIVAGILDALPFIGTGIVLTPLAIVQFFQGYYGRVAACLVLYVACVLLRELLEPKLIGRRIGVPPIAVLVSLYAGIRIFGVWGIIKGPLGFVLIYQTWRSVRKREDAENVGLSNICYTADK